MAADEANKYLKLLPYGGIAARISLNNISNYESDCKDLEMNILKGQMFTFLSLPIDNGLPIHCNGYFELSSNRRDLWWSNDGLLKYEWNKLLLNDVICDAYIEGIRYAKDLCENNEINIDMYYSLWPYQISINKNSPFQMLIYKVLNTIVDKEYAFLYSKLNNGTWLTFEKAVVYELNSVSDNLSNILWYIGLPIVALPCVQFKVLQQANILPSLLLPSYVREWMRNSNRNVLEMISNLESDNQIVLIEYLLNDLNDLNSQQSLNKLDFPQCLDMLPILPTLSFNNQKK
eukprot:108182_1